MTIATAIGTLTRKIERQDRVCVSQPPSGGPIVFVSADTADHVPTAAPRRLSSYAAPIIARLPGIIKAAATPCSERAATSHPIVGARAQPSEVIPNPAAPIAKINRRPR